MAKDPKKARRTNLRSPTTKGNDRYATFNAKVDAGLKLVESSAKAKFPASNTMRGQKLLREATKALDEENRLKKAGQRMARVQQASRAKRGK